MAAYDRDASLERQQIREISLNVARRLRQILDRNHYIPAALRPEVESTVRVITGIQRDIDQIMSGLPEHEALDFAILTHIMGGQRHALDLLEILEEKLEGGRSAYQRDSARVHQALLAVSREIEQDALRYTADSVPPAPPPRPSPPAGYAHAPPPAAAPGQGGSYPQPPPPAYASQPQQRPPSRKTPAPRPTAPARALPQQLPQQLRAMITSLAQKPVPVAVAALVLGAGIVVIAQALIGSSPEPQEDHRATTEAQDHAPDHSADTSQRTTVATAASLPGPATASSMEQPYLVVLATRRSTEELQQDYRTFKGNYPDLLGNAKARVDRVQGQDRNTWYRLSLIPPRTRDDAKALCSNLRKAGLTGCWIKPVPLH